MASTLFKEVNSTVIKSHSSFVNLALLQLTEKVCITKKHSTGKDLLIFIRINIDAVIPDKKLGFVDLKSMPNRVAFFAHRDSPLPSGSRNIDFYLSKLNQGGALKLSTGVFTPPVNGTYAFHFRGLAQEGEVRVRLYHNDYMVTSSWFDGGSEHGHLGLSALLKLATGDIVKLIQDGSGFIQDNGGYSTTFSGWLLEEDLRFF